MGHGRRYSDERKLNYKKVFAVIIAIIVVIMFVLIIRNILKRTVGDDTQAKKYFTVFADNKWGVIDQNGEYVIVPAYENMIVVPNEDKDVFLCMYNINDTEGTYQTKAINSKNEEIFTEYDQVEQVSNIDKSGNLYYLKNVLRVQKDGKYGLIDLDGNNVLGVEYTSIEAMQGKENIVIGKDGKFGLTDESGKIVLGVNYEEIVMPSDDSDLFVIKEAEQLKIIDKDGNVVLQDGFDDVKQIFSDGSKGIVYIKDGKYGAMNLSGEIIANPEYGYLQEIKENTYIAKKDTNYGVIDSLSNTLLEFSYLSIAYVKSADMYVVDVSDTESKVLDSSFTEKVSGIVNVYEDDGYFKVRVGQEYKYYDFNFEEKTNMNVLKNNTIFVSKKDGKYGFVDKSGNVVVDYIYDEAMEQNQYGYAAVKLNGLWGSVDKEGKVVISPKYNLEDYIKIDFIGKWHLGKYVDMCYYCEQ